MKSPRFGAIHRCVFGRGLRASSADRSDLGRLNLPGDYEAFSGLTDRPLKFTVTGPHMLSKTLVDSHYGGREDAAMAIADILRAQLQEIDAAAVQLDEANISGHADEAEWAARAVNRALEGVQGEKAVHICFGNYGGQVCPEGAV